MQSPHLPILPRTNPLPRAPGREPFGSADRLVRWQRLCRLGLVLLAVSWSGCQPAPNSPPAGKGSQTVPGASRDLVEETWEALLIQGSKVGWSRTRQFSVEADDQRLIRIEYTSQITLKRFGDLSEQSFEIHCLETPDGDLVSFESTVNMGAQPDTTRGKVQGEELEITSSSRGKSTSTRMAWPKGTGGFYATEESLRKRPLKPGERRALTSLLPILNQIATVELTAVDVEPIETISGIRNLLRVERQDKLGAAAQGAPQVIESTLWTDDHGEIIKSRVAAMDQVAERTTRKIALEESSSMEFDLGKASQVRLDRPLDNPRTTRQVRYRVTLPGADRANVFVSCPAQQIISRDDGSLELLVRALRPDTALPADAPGEDEPTDEDREPNHLLQSDDPRVARMSAEAIGEETDAWRQAVLLEQYVHTHMKSVNFNTALASAADVARTLSGDCTEHAVLLAALARAAEIPARVAIGLVYVESNACFAYHMWTEVYVQDRWLALDATLGQGGIAADHLKLSQTSLNNADAYSAFLPVAQVLGQLKIEVLEAD